MEKEIILKPTRERSVLLKHPWIFSGSIDRIKGDPDNGETVIVKTSRGEALGWAAFSAQSKIQARMWHFEPNEPVGKEFFRERIRRAIRTRAEIIPSDETDAYRLIHAESDGLPGVVVDRYVDWLVIQILSAGAEYWRDTLYDLLVEECGLGQIYERSDVDVRQLEGLAPRAGLVRGGAIPEDLVIQEGGHRFFVDIEHGHKTGFYLDQRTNRQRFGGRVNGKSVLNCFAYTGAFTVYGLANGARHVLSVDSSGDMLAMGRRNIELNGLPTDRAEWMEGDVFNLLRLFRDQAKTFDVIVLDPPKFAPTAAQAERAARGYKDINLLAFKLLNPGGLLYTFSCSGGISPDLFQKIIAGAALDAQADANIIEYLHQGSDHPVSLHFPEGEYLKGLVVRKQ